MSSDSSSAELQINIKGPNELKLQINITPDKTVRELKEAVAEKSDVEADRQRLIYSGRVLKDDDPLTTYKIQSGHTIHMVKSAARSAASSSSTTTPSAPQPLPTMQTGQNPHDPLTQLNSHLGFGAMAGLNPFADMGLNPNDPNMLQTMLSSPQFLQQMSSTMSNPAVLDQIIASNPQLAAAGPRIREIFQSEQFRQMMSNPESLRTMLQMASMFNGGGGASPFGAAQPSFPAPGLPGQPNAPTNTTSTPSTNPASPTTGLGAGAGAGAGAGGLPPFDPNALRNMLSAMGGAPGAGAGAGAGGDPFAALGGFGGLGGLGGLGGFGAGLGSPPPAPADSRPPEERFQTQLQQLQEMGFTNAAQNIRALLATGGNVHSAIEYILGGGGL